MRLDHLVYAVADLSPAQDDLGRRLGVTPLPGGRHPGVGTHNALVGLGPGAYLEIIAPDPGRGVGSAPLPFGLSAGGLPRLAGWALRTHDIARAVQRARENGFDPGEVASMGRVTPAGVALTWRLTPPPSGNDGGLIPFLIEWGETEHPSRRALQACRLVHLRGEHPDPARIMGVMAALGATLEIGPAARAALVAVIDGPTGRVELR